MTREDACFERILLVSGFCEGYDKWLDKYLESENPLSEIVLKLVECGSNMKEVEHCLKLVECGSNMKEVEHCLNLYSLEEPINETEVYSRLHSFLKESYESEKMTQDEVISAMRKFSAALYEYGFSSAFHDIPYYYDLVNDGLIDKQKFDKAFRSFLLDNEKFSADDLWINGYFSKKSCFFSRIIRKIKNKS